MARRRALVTIVVLLAVTAAACDRDASSSRRRSTPTSVTTSTSADGDGAAAACEVPAEPLPAGRSQRTTTVNGQEREYLAYVPRAAATGQRPLVFTIHGYGSSATQQFTYTGIEAVAEREGFIAVAPQGLGSPARFEIVGTTDVDFVAQLIDELAKLGCIDTTRVYAMGMSNGAGLSAALACRIGDRLAAIAPVALVIYADALCGAAPPVPIMAFMGTDDPVVPFDGGTVTCCGNPTVRSAPDAMADWATHNGCDPQPEVAKPADDVERRTWKGCDGGADTVFYVIEGGGHTWPGATPISMLGKTTSNIEATDEIWSFFAERSTEREGGGSS